MRLANLRTRRLPAYGMMKSARAWSQGLGGQMRAVSLQGVVMLLLLLTLHRLVARMSTLPQEIHLPFSRFTRVITGHCSATAFTSSFVRIRDWSALPLA